MSEISSTSELTTKEIVEQAIQDYHNTILPHLNGMVPTIANKFDKSNLYSTDEQIVGRWIDGKPLYQKTITTTSNEERQYVDGLNIDTPVYGWVNTFTRSSTGNVKIYSNVSPYEQYTITIGSFRASRTEETYYPSGAVVDFFIGSTEAARFSSLVYTLQYTKTTDEAIAIGSDTDYSTTEKIVGTWIDGKPLYQKTIPATMGNLNVDVEVSVASLKIDTVVSCSGTINGYRTQPLSPYSGTANGALKCFYDSVGDAVYFRNELTADASGKSCTATILYTKTTD